MFEYPHLAVAFDDAGDVRAIVSAEFMPPDSSSCFLGLFTNDGHSNYGPGEDWRNLDTFVEAAASLLREILAESIEPG